MNIIAISILATLFFISWWGTYHLAQTLLNTSLLDIPNDRSSHQVPTPRAGGVVFVGLLALAWAIGGFTQTVDWRIVVTLLGGGSAVALSGFYDDRFSLSFKYRLTIHFLAAIWALAWMPHMPVWVFNHIHWSLSLVTAPFWVFWIVWMTNLYNFMDGIDGLAGGQAIFLSLGGLLLIQHDPLLSWSLGFVAASALGFLVWNWAPAKIFMGDVGSAFLGYYFAVIMLIAVGKNPASFWAWMILTSLFWVDTSYTLIRRVMQKLPWYQAHCSHGYQQAAKKWGSHSSVTLGMMFINLVWILPLAVVANQWSQWGYWFLIMAVVPIILIDWFLKAGIPTKKI